MENTNASSGAFQVMQGFDTGFYDYQVLHDSDSGYSILYTAISGRRKLVLKAVKKEEGKTTENLMRLQREYQLMEHLYGNEHVVNLIGWRDDEKVGPCIVMEFVDGMTLDAYLETRPSIPERKRILNELLDAVESLHDRQVIHNDLKPSNILITRVGQRVKLIDFGYADCDVQVDKATGGTIGYASPELEQQKKVDGSSDIYSLGLLIKMLLPHRLRQVVKKCLQENPKKRFQSVEAIKKSLKKKKAWIVAGACVVVLLALVYGANTLVSNRIEKIAQEVVVEENPDPCGMHALYDSVYQVYEAQLTDWLDTGEYQYMEFANNYWLRFLQDVSNLYQEHNPDDFEEQKRMLTDYQFYIDFLSNRLKKLYEDLPSYSILMEEDPALYLEIEKAYYEKLFNL